MPLTSEHESSDATPALFLSPGDVELIGEMRPHFEAAIVEMSRRISAAVRDLPHVEAVFAGAGENQTDGLPNWLDELLGGRYDENYRSRRARQVRRLVRLGVSQSSVFAAMSQIREEFHRVLTASGWRNGGGAMGHTALDRLCDIELSIMLDTYREAYVRQVRDAERLATIGQVAASIGHDLRNPLAVMQTSLQLLERRIESTPRARRHVTRIANQIALCTVIISDLLELARDRPPELRPTLLTELIDEAAGSVPRTDQVKLVLQLSQLPEIAVDPGQVRQLMVNLVLNAVQAVGPKGEVVVRVEADDTVVRIEVQDDGPGMPKEVAGRLFEPMFTTRAGGTGLGLVVCRRVVENHAGKVTAHNVEGGGALFVVVLPRDIAGALAARRDEESS